MKSRSICSIPECGGKAVGRKLCNKHYLRWLNHGDPLGGKKTFMGEPAKWFDKYSSYQGDECVLWPFETDADGYGRCNKNFGDVLAHRVMCTRIHGGKPSAKHQVAHSCGKRNCVNPKHLRWATKSENEKDKIVHGTNNRFHYKQMDVR